MSNAGPTIIFLLQKPPGRKTVMEELHRTHKEVPVGYWTLWVIPALQALRKSWRKTCAERRALKQALTFR